MRHLIAVIVGMVALSGIAHAQDENSEGTQMVYATDSMKGSYGFAFSDFNSFSYTGTIVTDGLGHISPATITLTYNDNKLSKSCSMHLSGGTYSVGSTGKGTMTLTIASSNCGTAQTDFCTNGTYLIQVAQQGSVVAITGNYAECKSGWGFNYYSFTAFRE